MPTDRSAEQVPLANPRAEVERLRAQIDAAIARVLDSGHYILGPEVRALEDAVAKRTGAAGAVGVGTGTDALAIALLGAGVGAGEEVIAPSHTAGPTVAAIRMVGGIPVLAEVDGADYCITPEAVASAIGPRTRAVIAVHLYGHPARIAEIKALAEPRGIAVIEDCAQAQGSRIGGREVGAIGDLGCFSFYPTKNLGAIGDGGAVTASTQALLERVRKLRTYGWTKSQYAEIENGRCSRLDEVQAAILSAKLVHIDWAIEARRAIAARYAAGFAGLPLTLPTERDGTRHTYHLYVVRTPRRDGLAEHLAGKGVMTGRHYPFAVHQQPGLVAKARIPEPLTGTEQIVREILSLPMYADMPAAQVDRVITGVQSFFGRG